MKLIQRLIVATLLAVLPVHSYALTTISGTTGVSKVQDGIVGQAALAANVAGNGPAFSAYQSTQTSIANAAAAKVAFQTEEYDTGGFFDSITNFRFQPNIAGYYAVSAGVYFQVALTGSYIYPILYKNGVQYKNGPIATAYGSQGAWVVYLNGSTDYIELFAYQNSGSAQNTAPNAYQTFFQGYLARSAQ